MELKASDLRIGNWVNNSVHGVYQIGGIDIRSNNVWLISQNRSSQIGTTLSFIEPIPLTEEWLVKCGFDANGCIRLGIDTSFETLQITKNGDVLVFDSNEDFVCLKNI